MVTHAADPLTKRLQCLMRHIENVREDCELLGTRLIERGEFDFGKTLIQHGQTHDNSKFEGIEWQELCGQHDGKFHEALQVHVHTNPHHPEYWDGGIHQMTRIYLAEAVCDWHARSTEFGTALRPWIDGVATQKFSFSTQDRAYRDIQEFVNLLLEPQFET